MKALTRIILFFLAFFPTILLYATEVGFGGIYPKGTIASDGLTVIGILSLIQSILLKVALPIVVIGTSLYVAYELFTAEGDETKMKKAWKSLTFSAIGLVCIAVSYAFVSVLAGISL